MKCNCCGKELSKLEEENTGNISIPFKYGSVYDGKRIKFSLCSRCYDMLAFKTIIGFKIAPQIVDVT